MRILLAAFLVAALAVTAEAPVRGQGTTRLTETGSSLLYPVIAQWAQAYKSVDASTTLTTESSGSGAGIKAAASGAATIGATDAYLSSAELQRDGLLNIALTISAQTITYNVPEVGDERLNFSGAVLSGIYRGTITMWDDRAIAAINLHIAGKLPHAAIVPIRRSDSSGDTQLFTTYLSKSDATWNSSVGSGLEVKWPAVASELSAAGNPGVLAACTSTKYALCYLGISFLMQANNKGVYYAALSNSAGSFITPSIDSIKSAATSMIAQTPSNQGVSLVFAPAPDSYPIVNYEYGVVKAKQPDTATAKALQSFLRWAVSRDGGNNGGNLLPGFTSLPPEVSLLSEGQIDSIH